jgi:hypothetical protein
MIQKVEHKVLESIESQSQAYRGMFKDKRLFTTFQGIIEGILVSGSSRIGQIARSSPLADKAHSEKRIRRFVHGEHQRAEVNAETLIARLLAEGCKRLKNAKQVTVIIDGSDLRKRYSQKLEHLSSVRSLEGTLVAGYPTLNAIGIAEDGTKALLYHETYSSEASGFKSQNELVNAALRHRYRTA